MSSFVQHLSSLVWTGRTQVDWRWLAEGVRVRREGRSRRIPQGKLVKEDWTDGQDLALAPQPHSTVTRDFFLVLCSKFDQASALVTWSAGVLRRRRSCLSSLNFYLPHPSENETMDTYLPPRPHAHRR